jgi:hypothetical protein
MGVSLALLYNLAATPCSAIKFAPMSYPHDNRDCRNSITHVGQLDLCRLLTASVGGPDNG